MKKKSQQNFFTSQYFPFSLLKLGLFFSLLFAVAASIFLFSCDTKNNVFRDEFVQRPQSEKTSSALKPEDLPEDITFWSDYPDEVLAQVLVQRMSDSELLAQIFMFGWAGQEPSALLNQWVLDRGLGSVKVFGWNTDDINLVAESIAALQEKSQSRIISMSLPKGFHKRLLQ